MNGAFSSQVRTIVARRAMDALGLLCCERCCAAASDLQYHHRRPRGKGGSKASDTGTVSNCLLLCGACHLFVESYRTQALEFGWLVRQSKSPAEIPVFYQREWVLLDNDGHTYRIPIPTTGTVS
jgi:hypothetical protein